MKTLSYITITITLLFISSGCDKENFSPRESNFAVLEDALFDSGHLPEQSLLQANVIPAAGFEIEYKGREYRSGQTTFSYQVSGPVEDMQFRLELPSCAPSFSSLSPSNGTTGNNDPYINPGVEWHPPVGSGKTNSFDFSITYPGDVREGIVLASIKTKNNTEVVEVPGACARVFDISGSIFTDANKNGELDNDELGIDDVDVLLIDENDAIKATASTNEQGEYLFEAIPIGDYQVKIDESSVVVTAVTYLNATSPLSIPVSIGPDSFDNDFGFEPKTDKLLNDLKADLLKTTGKTANYWKTQLKVAITGKGNADFSKATLINYIAQIRSFLLADPFPLSGGNGLQAAFDVLDRPARSDRAQLERELLATELNHFAGFGILDADRDLQVVLLSWGESLLASGGGNPNAASSSTTENTSTNDDINTAIDIFGSLNKSSGGGGGN